MNRIEEKIYLVTKTVITAVAFAVFLPLETWNYVQDDPGVHQPIKRVEVPITTASSNSTTGDEGTQHSSWEMGCTWLRSQHTVTA